MKNTFLIIFLILFNIIFCQEGQFPIFKSSDSEYESSLKLKYDTSVDDINTGYPKKHRDYLKQSLLERYNASIEILRNEMLIDNGLVYHYVDSVFKVLKQKNSSIACKKVFIINESYSNAFTSCDDYVFITSGMLSSISSFDELAFILAHEISHNEMNHFEKKLNYQFGISTNDSLIRSIKKLRNQQYGVNKSLDNIFTNQYILKGKLSKKCEIEADSMALKLVQSCGISKEAAVNTFKLFEKMEGNTDSTRYDIVSLLDLPKQLDYSRNLNYVKESSLGEIEKTKNDTLNYLLSTHPYPKERIELIQKSNYVNSVNKGLQSSNSNNFQKFKLQASKDAIYYSFFMKNLGNSFYLLLKHLDTYPNDHTFDAYLPLYFSVLGVNKKNRTESEVLENPSGLYSESYNRMLHFFKKLKPQECAEISQYYISKLKTTSHETDYSVMMNAMIQDNLEQFKIYFNRYNSDTEYNYHSLVKDFYSRNKSRFK